MDGFELIWEKLQGERNDDLFHKFSGSYRAIVVETNDPLGMYRVRFKIPEMHDEDMKTEDCPWAVPAPWLGGKGSGFWSHPIIGDVIWINFEKNHPYGPIWIGFAGGTRRKRYVLESIFTRSPLALKLDGTADEMPDDYLLEYLPKDLRPMSLGCKDRYGNLFLVNSMGFFPSEHGSLPASNDQDPFSNKNYAKGSLPKINDPDRKMIGFLTKYGHLMSLSDVGYNWKKDGEFGEFLGNFDDDRQFEINRSKYYTKLLNEGSPKELDQRKILFWTRAGHKFEMRDVGWAQNGGARSGSKIIGKTFSRAEFSDPKILSREKEKDQRWIKYRTKGGMLIQLMDMGFHPENDNFYKRPLESEVGACDDEDAWDGRDSRQIRFVTRYGVKIVLDDRGTDPLKAEVEEMPRGLGWLLKTRRSWTDYPSTPRGFGFEAVDRDELNCSRWYSPKSKVIELNDRFDYMMMATDVSGDVSEEWMKLKDNEFSRSPVMSMNPQEDTFHMKLDKKNGYIRFKTSGGNDAGRRGAGGGDVGVNQGIECRDGRFGSDGAWTEMVDLEDRGLWFSKKEGISILRSKDGKDMFVLLRDRDNSVLIRNAEKSGLIQLYCAGNVEVISGENIAFKAGKKISLKAGSSIDMEAGGSGHAKLTSNAWYQDVPDNAPKHTGFLPGASPGGGAQSDTGQGNEPLDPQPKNQEKRKPYDRGAVAVLAEIVGKSVIEGVS